jgi:hypothetical protein
MVGTQQVYEKINDMKGQTRIKVGWLTMVSILIISYTFATYLLCHIYYKIDINNNKVEMDQLNNLIEAQISIMSSCEGLDRS